MARIKDSSVREVVAAADMVEVVSARTQLRRSGPRWTGRCPFHEENTPSFSVNPGDKLFYCFGCGKGGDVITFVRDTEQLDFAQAVEWLADRFRVTLEYEESSPQLDAARARRDRLAALLDQAASFYERCLWDSEAGQAAREYLAGRGLGEEVCRAYRLGLAPDGPGLSARARAKGFTPAELAAAGLANRRGNDYFPAGRVMFPLADPRGRILGFGARRMREDDPLAGKYVNSPEGELFHKSDVVYGLHRARTAIAREDRTIVVEGYTDVLALHQAEIEPVVASMGTALTERQLQELTRFSKRLYLCFDADAAGEEATLRGMVLAAGRGFDVRVVRLEAGLDPADAVEGFDRRLKNAESHVKHQVRLLVDQSGGDRQRAWVAVSDYLSTIEESPLRDEAVSLATDQLRLSRDQQATLGAARRTSANGSTPERLSEQDSRLEKNVLAACLAHPSLRPLLVELTPEHFDSARHRDLRGRLIAGGDARDGGLEGPAFAELDARAADEGIDERTGKQLLLLLRKRHVERELSRADASQLGRLQQLVLALREEIRKLDQE